MIRSAFSRVIIKSSVPVFLALAIAAFAGCVLLSSSSAARGEIGPPSIRAGEKVRLETGTVNGLVVDRYTWRDSKGRPRSASLARYGQKVNGQPRGGFAAQFTYQALEPETGKWSTVELDVPEDRGDAGFGYFVSHEAYRLFDADVCPDGSNNCPIAHVHGEDDSPLGLRLPGKGRNISLTSGSAVHEFTLNYPHWGTTVPVREPSSDPTPSDPAKHKKYDLPVTIRWKFTNGQDYPLWSVSYDLSSVPADRVSADMRGPYGYMDFAPSNAPLTKLEWADKFKFSTKGTNVSTNSEWAWNTPNRGARYNLLVADGGYEMGLVEAVPYSSSKTGTGWSASRGKTSAAGPGCPDAGWRMPCDWSWPYQSIQYEAFDENPSRAKKIAWGTAPYAGTTKTNDDVGEPFAGYPKASYRVWITFDRSGGSRTRNLAASIK